MPRVARVDIAGYPYHVINRAVMRLPLFNCEEDYALFESLLFETSRDTGMRILAYALMPNHWHLVLYPQEDGDLKIFMHRLTNAHTRLVHSLTNTIGTGPLYQGRYKSFLIEDDSHLLTVLKYVERNAVRAKLTSRAELWRWGSAWRRTSGTTAQQQQISKSPAPLPSNYLEWVNTPEVSEDVDAVRNSVNKGSPYGTESWVEKTCKQYGLNATLRKPGRPKLK